MASPLALAELVHQHHGTMMMLESFVSETATCAEIVTRESRIDMEMLSLGTATIKARAKSDD
jgi:hypothetical protein